jgi:hypothetical protein
MAPVVAVVAILEACAVVSWTRCTKGAAATG